MAQASETNYNVFYYRLTYANGKQENFKMTIDTDSFLDLWNETKPRCQNLEPISELDYRTNSMGKVVLTYPVSKLTKNDQHKTAVYEVYEHKSRQLW